MMSGKPSQLFALLLVLALLLTACAQPVPIAPAAAAPAAEAAVATGEEGAAAAGEKQRGGVWTRVTPSDAGNLNPILWDNSASLDVVTMVYEIGLLGGSPETGEVSCEGALCESWTVSDDGMVYTFKLREGLTWSDGDPIDAADFVYTYEAIRAEGVASPRTYVWDGIESIEAPDANTVVVTYNILRCDAIQNVGLPLMPSHLFAADYSDVMTNALNEAPTVTSGPFVFQSWARDDNIIIARNEGYYQGAPYMDGMIYRIVPDAGARLAQLLSGESDIATVQPNQLSAIEGNPNITRYTWKDDGYTYIGLNQADPANPQPGLDEDGNVIPQAPHPILGDKNVRQAIAYALDYDTIINDIYFGQGYRMAANVLPAVEWAYNNDLAPYPFDTAKAISLLEEAGWVDGNGDGVREKDGKDLALNLITNAGNTTRGDLGAYVQDTLNKIGFNIDFQIIEFGTMLAQIDAQTTDMFILAWTGLGSEPNDDAFWRASQDIPGSGFNNVSFYNARVEELLTQGYSVPGCATEDRAPFYKEIQEIMQDEVPYIFVSGLVGNIGYNSRWDGIDPQPWAASAPVYWNTHEWSLTTVAE